MQFDLVPQSRQDRTRFYVEALGKAAATSPEVLRAAKRWLDLNDLFYLLTVTLARKDVDHDWLFDRCQMVQEAPDEYLDLWAREHYKSTIITFGKTIQDILIDPEETFGIFSHTRPSAKSFLRQIMNELERNEPLKLLHDDVLWWDPEKAAPKWSEDDGIVVKRKGNPKESTVEAWGLLEALPTGKHFGVRIYDDIIDKKAVNTPDQIKKITENWELSLSLGKRGGRSRYIGTRYHMNDPYLEIMKRGAAKKRLFPVTSNGTENGDPVFMTRAEVAKKRREMGPFTFAAQMLQDPTADRQQGFQATWLQYYDNEPSGAGMNVYIIGDPASKKKATSDYTAIGVIGLGADRNYHLLDGIHDRLNLRERADALFALHREWQPKGVGWEEYGLQCDIEYFKERMERENYRFDVTPLGGRTAKTDRIKRLVPVFEEGRFYMPRRLFKEDYQGRRIDIIQTFVDEEYNFFPVGLHDDFFDMIARILDEAMVTVWPRGQIEETSQRYVRKKSARRRFSAWAA